MRGIIIDEVIYYENTEKCGAFYIRRPCLYGARTTVAQENPLEYVSCRRDLFPFDRQIGAYKATASSPTPGAGGCRDHYYGRAGGRITFQPGLDSLGLPNPAGKFPGDDLSAIFHSLDPYGHGGRKDLSSSGAETGTVQNFFQIMLFQV